MNLWSDYRDVLYETFSDLKVQSKWAEWEAKGAHLQALSLIHI